MHKNAFSKHAVSWSNKSWATFCCTSSEVYIFLIKYLSYFPNYPKWHEFNTLECIHFYFLYPCSAHLHEIGTSCLIVLDLEYFLASRQWPFLFWLPSKEDRHGRDDIYCTKTNIHYFLWESINTVLSVLFATKSFHTIKENNKEKSFCQGKITLLLVQITILLTQIEKSWGKKSELQGLPLWTPC